MTSERTSEPTPTSSDFRTYSSKLFRVVEAQHTISTNRLTDDPAEQEVLEKLIEEAKPTIPPAARDLHYLLGTAFRYGYWKATRFRRAHERAGIFYASEGVPTAVAETAFWRMRFVSASPGMKLPSGTVEHLAFSVPVRVSRAFDLTVPPLVAGRASWIDPDDYGPCQRFADVARALDAQLIRYESARDPARGMNAALLDPAAFQKPVPKGEQTWHFRFADRKLTTFAALPSRERYTFTFEQFGLLAP
jgi:RES domain-containing protein